MNSAKPRTGPADAWLLAAGLGALVAIAAPGNAGAQTVSQAVSQSGAASATFVPQPGPPTATPMTDLLTRMDSLERQVTRLTEQNEEMAHRQRELEARLPALVVPTPATTDTPAVAAPAAVPAPAVANSATTANLTAMTSGTPVRSGEARPTGPAHPSAQRIAAVKAVIKPDTGNAAMDDYSYGFRLYTAKFYPEAAQQFKFYIDKYPKDDHISHARNLLGRAYLDDGKPRDAAPWFLTNYKTDPHGPRAADSLLGLADAMHQLGDNSRACIALNEFAATYAAEAKGRLRGDYGKTRDGLTCN